MISNSLQLKFLVGLLKIKYLCLSIPLPYQRSSLKKNLKIILPLKTNVFKKLNYTHWFDVFRRKEKLVQDAEKDHMTDADCDKEMRAIEEEQVSQI